MHSEIIQISKQDIMTLHNFLSILENILAKKNGDGISLNFQCDDVKAIQRTMRIIEDVVNNDMKQRQ